MAAPMENTHARISLDFVNIERENCWFLLVYSELPTINDVSNKIVKHYDLDPCVSLYLKDRLLPGWESSYLIKNEDNITVTESKQSTHGGQTLDHANIPEANIDRKRKKKKKEKDCGDDEYQTPADAEITLCSSKKKKKKRKHSETTQEDRKTIEASKASIASTKHNKTEKSAITDDSESVSSKTMDDCHTSSVDIVGASVDTNASSISDELNQSEATEEPLKKRKRIRQHRKRNKGQSEQNTSSSFCEGQISSTSTRTVGGDRYKGRKVDKDELFFGSIPDKLENPKHYRHNYRNLKVYQPVPNSHQVFKSDDEDESEAQGSTEQYNFLSSTKILEDREQSIENETNDVSHNRDNRSYVTPNVQAHNSSTGQSCESEQTSKAELYHDKSYTLNLTTSYQDSKLLDTVNTPKFKNDTSSWDMTPIRECDRSLQSNFTHKSEQDALMAMENTTVDMADVYGSNRTSSPIPSPTVLSRKMLPNGVSVFVRQRANKKGNSAQPIRELSKEEQLNTIATNKSTVFKVPQISQAQSPSLPKTPSVKSKDQTELAQPSTLYNSTPQEAPAVDRSMGIEKTTNGSRPTVDQSAGIEKATNGSRPVSSGTTSNDYCKLPQLKGIPVVGMIIAYRVLEMSLSCTPEVSAYKEAEVLAVDPTDMVTLKNRLFETELKFNKFHVEIEDDEGVLTSTAKEQEQITVHASSLLETRIIKQP